MLNAMISILVQLTIVVEVISFSFLSSLDSTSICLFSISYSMSFFIFYLFVYLSSSLSQSKGSQCVGSTNICECQENIDCSDSNICTTDICDGGTCIYQNNTMPCDDGFYCNGY